MADNTLTIKQKSTLPVSRTRQDKSLFRSLSGAYPPPVDRKCVSSCSAATSPSRTSATPAPLLSPPASACALHPFYMTTCAAATAACGPGAKMNLAYTTGPFSVPNCPARPSRTTEGLILYGAMGGRRHRTASGSSLKSAAARCEPIPVFPLPPEPPTCLAWLSATPVASRCEPFSPNRLIPASRDSGSDRHYGSGRPETGSLLRCFCVEQEAACSRCAAQQDIPAVPYR